MTYDQIKAALNDLSCDLLEAGIYSRVVRTFATYLSLEDYHKLLKEMAVELPA